MTRERVTTDGAPAAIGPYSQAIRAGGMIFLAGQIPIDPASGALVDGGVEAQTERVMMNLSAILQAAGASLADVVKTTVYLADMKDFESMNRVYGRFFESEDPPARATLQVSRLPRGASVEIDAIAVAEGD